MAISVIEPVGRAITRTGQILFAPFDITKWLVLGFCAFLAQLMEGGANFNYGSRNYERGHSGGGPELPEHFSDAVAMGWHWLVHHPFWAVLIAVVLVLLIVITVVLTWLKARGKFMFLDGVVLNRGAVVEPWRRFRVLANSLFWFYVLTGLVLTVLLAGTALGLVVLIWPGLATGHLSPGIVVAIVLGSCVLLPCELAVIALWAVFENLVIPVMYLRGLRVWPAWGVFGREVLRGHVGAVVLFCLMRALIAVVLGIASLLACCFTCCLAALPYIGTVILLPLSTFDRCYGLYFLQQYGEGWRFFADEAPAPPEPAPAV